MCHLRNINITLNKSSIALALVGLAISLAPAGLIAIGYQLSLAQGYVVLAVALFLIFGALIVLFWPYTSSREILGHYLKQMRQWIGDKDKPLALSPPEDARRKLASDLTSETLENLNPRQKGSVLRFLYGQGLIFRDNTVVPLNFTDFSNARLRDVELSNANLIQANLKNADLTNAKLYTLSVYGQAKTEAEQEGVPPHNFVHFAGCDLRDAILKGTVLKNAGLAGCDFDSADFEGANLDRADLRGAELRATRNLTQGQIERAYGSYGREWVEDTQLPEGLRPPAAWSKPIHEQKRERARQETVRLERACAGP